MDLYEKLRELERQGLIIDTNYCYCEACCKDARKKFNLINVSVISYAKSGNYHAHACGMNVNSDMLAEV